MNYAKYTTVLLILLFVNVFVTNAQNESVLLTGIVATGDNLNPLPNTNILVVNRNVGTASDEKGYFSFMAQFNDTIVFSAIGFKDGVYIVPDSLNENHYSIVQIMTNDTVYLQETIIYPWKSYEEFGEELIMMQPPPTDDDRAKANLSNAQLYERYTNIYMDGDANYKYQTQLRSEKAYFAGQIPPYQIFDAFSWIEFVNSWKRGDYKK